MGDLRHLWRHRGRPPTPWGQRTESVFSGTLRLAYPIGSDDEACRSSWSLTDVPDGWSRDDAPFTVVTDRVESTVAQAAAVAGDGIVGNSCD
jgi:hypothetical protein